MYYDGLENKAVNRMNKTTGILKTPVILLLWHINISSLTYRIPISRHASIYFIYPIFQRQVNLLQESYFLKTATHHLSNMTCICIVKKLNTDFFFKFTHFCYNKSHPATIHDTTCVVIPRQWDKIIHNKRETCQDTFFFFKLSINIKLELIHNRKYMCP